MYGSNSVGGTVSVEQCRWLDDNSINRTKTDTTFILYEMIYPYYGFIIIYKSCTLMNILVVLLISE